LYSTYAGETIFVWINENIFNEEMLFGAGKVRLLTAVKF
jgi:hypothetical protein